MSATQHKTILIVEDSKSLREILAFTLRNRGWTVVESDNGDDALEKATTMDPDLILLDVIIPGKTGFEICSALKGDDRYRHIPILILSSITRGSGKSDEHWKQLSNADEFISKPFQAHHLLRRIEDLLGTKPVRKPDATVEGEIR